MQLCVSRASRQEAKRPAAGGINLRIAESEYHLPARCTAVVVSRTNFQGET